MFFILGHGLKKKSKNLHILQTKKNYFFLLKKVYHSFIYNLVSLYIFKFYKFYSPSSYISDGLFTDDRSLLDFSDGDKYGCEFAKSL